MASATRTQALPKLSGIPQEAAEEIRQVVSMNQRLQSRIEVLEKAGFLTKTTADPLYSPSVMSKELSANGSAPLNVVLVGTRNILMPQPVKKGGA